MDRLPTSLAEVARRPLNSNYVVEPNHVYFELQAVNNDTSGEGIDRKLVFTETRNSPLIHTAEDYYMSVVRFFVQTPSLPVFIPLVDLNQTAPEDPNQLIYKVTLKYTGTGDTQTESVMYTPQNINAPVPAPPSIQQDLGSEYYYIYQFSEFIKMLNTALTAALTGLKATVGAPIAAALDPFFVIDPETSIITLYAEKAFFGDALANPIEIYVNGALFNLVSSLEFEYYSSNPNNQKHRLKVHELPLSLNVEAIGGDDYILSKQEYPTTPLWNPVAAVVFEATLVPIVPQQNSKPEVFGSEVSPSGRNGNNSLISAVLTDLVVPLSKGNETKPSINYVPTAEYRLVDLQGKGDVKSIQVSCFWKDIFGGLHPFTLGSGCAASIKILFRRKNFDHDPSELDKPLV